MVTKGDNTNTLATLLSVGLLLQFFLLPSAVMMAEYCQMNHSAMMTCHMACCTGSTRKTDHCPMPQAGMANHAKEGTYFCDCNHSSPDFITVTAIGSEFIVNQNILLHPNRQIEYLLNAQLFQFNDPFLPISRPPG